MPLFQSNGVCVVFFPLFFSIKFDFSLRIWLVLFLARCCRHHHENDNSIYFLFLLLRIIFSFTRFGASDGIWKPLILCYFVGIAQDRFLEYSPDQHPIVLQIGGNNLDNIAKATELANSYCYDEINLKFVKFFSTISWFSLSFFFSKNWPYILSISCGCPSPKVAGHGCFGVRLMLDPKVWNLCLLNC